MHRPLHPCHAAKLRLLLAILPTAGGSDWIAITGLVVGVVWAGVLAWDIVDGFRKAWRADRTR